MADLVLVRFFPKPGRETQVESILRGMVVNTRQEPGCLRYDLLNTQLNERDVFVLFEKYQDQAALEAHRATPHYKDYRRDIMDHLSEPIEVSLLTNLDVHAG
jgi:quinol monooxygenase YgiN